MAFKDYFSKHSPDYVKYRPRYPDALFVYLASLCPSHQQVWDCGTGNGQAALSLTACFRRVVATDASEAQLQQTVPHDQITYQRAPAEASGLSDRSCDLVIVAQALHWFDLTQFYLEAKRVLKSEGVLAVWCYELMQICPEVDQQVRHYYQSIVGDYWPAERQLIEQRYQTIVFPFAEIEPPAFSMTATWSFQQLVGYLNTWSATQRFLNQHQKNPLEQIQADLAIAWGDLSACCPVVWPIHLRVGRVQNSTLQ